MIFLSCTEKRKNIYHTTDRTLYSQSCTTNICYQQLQQRFQYRSSATLQLKIKPASRVLMMPQGRNPIQLKSLFGPDHAARFNCRLQNTNLEHKGLEELRSRRIGGSESLGGKELLLLLLLCCCCCNSNKTEPTEATTASKGALLNSSLLPDTHCCSRHPFIHRIFLHLAVLRLLVTGSSVFTLRAHKRSS